MPRYQLPEVQEVRAVKTAREVSYIVKAQRIAEQVLEVSVRHVKVGVSEIQLARFIVAEFKRRGVKALAFEPIVAFGKGSADIHHWATNVRLKINQIVMFDFGATYQGYCSDMTRTFFFGKPTVQFKRTYQNVARAQAVALSAIKGGERRAGRIDAAARKLIERTYSRNSFPHGLGHGLGVAIHEWPAMKPGSADILKPGMVVTLEPGVYIKGWGGIRIEDMVHIKQREVINLTKATKDYLSMLIRR